MALVVVMFHMQENTAHTLEGIWLKKYIFAAAPVNSFSASFNKG